MAADPILRTGSICRRCLEPGPATAERCARCGSPKVLRHPELHALSTAHLDCDAFYAAIEKRDRPELADLPVIVGGGKRGVVATACYIARIKGVRSAMPMFKALELCPDAIVIPPDMRKYAGVGREVRQLMQELTPLVEPVSIDEAFLDLAGTETLHRASPAVLLVRLAARIEKEIGITVSVGLSFNKFLAKLASDLDKPRGFSVVGRAEALDVLAPMPVSRIWGVGKVLQAQLERDGIERIGQLQAMDEAALMKAYGIMGQRLFRLSRAEDGRRVSPDGETKSVSAETTFDEDVADREKLSVTLRALAERVSASLKRQGLAGRTVTLKLKTPDFKLKTRSRTLADATQLADRIWRAGTEMLLRESGLGPVRLIGIGVSEMTALANADPPDLVDPAAGRRAGAERAMDAIREKFGSRAVELGVMLKGTQQRSPRRP